MDGPLDEDSAQRHREKLAEIRSKILATHGDTEQEAVHIFSITTFLGMAPRQPVIDGWELELPAVVWP